MKGFDVVADPEAWDFDIEKSTWTKDFPNGYSATINPVDRLDKRMFEYTVFDPSGLAFQKGVYPKWDEAAEASHFTANNAKGMLDA